MKIYPYMTIIYILNFQAVLGRNAVAQMFEAVCYQSEDRDFESQMGSLQCFNMHIRSSRWSLGRYSSPMKSSNAVLVSFSACMCGFERGVYMGERKTRRETPRMYTHYSSAIFYDYPVIGSPPPHPKEWSGVAEPYEEEKDHVIRWWLWHSCN
jgi:hypothetical protein